MRLKPRWWALLAVLLFATLSSAQGCSSTSPCTVGCCGKFGFCGFGPDFCGTGNCTANCDRQAECGRGLPSLPALFFLPSRSK